MSNNLDYICANIETNVIQKIIGMTIEEIRAKIEYGDYVTLAKMLGIDSPVTAKMRFLRGNEEAHTAMEKIISSREELIESFQKNQK